MPQPLSDVRVVEFAEGIAGPYVGKLLADYGADVVKVETPEGDRARRLGPFPEGLEGNLEQSATFLHLNTNKRSVIAEPGSELVRSLVAGADVVIQSSPVPDPTEMRAANPDLVVLTVTPFGLTGPYAGYQGEEIVHFAAGGPMSATGSPDREPLKMGADVGQYECGTIGGVAALAGLAVAASGGGGCHIDLSNVDSQVTSIDRRMTYLLYGAYRGENVPRFGGYSVSPFPGGCRPAGDGHVQISTLMNWIPRMLAVMQDPDMAELYDDPMWIINETLPDIADGLLLGWSVVRTRQEAMEQAQAGGWPVTAVNRPIDLLTDPHFDERGFFVPVEHPEAGVVRQPGAPFRMDDGWVIRRPAPLLGQHTHEVMAEVSAEVTEEVALQAPQPAVAAPPAAQRLPLEGVRVLDMSVVWAGPYATLLLGDLGADVIRVDNPWVFPSATRGVMPRPTKEMISGIGGIFGGYPDAEPGERPWDRVSLFTAHARNKRSITLDLRQDSGREAFLRLVDESDVLVENNSAELLDKLGIGWDVLHARNPKLIAVRMPSVGLEGPYRSYLGFGVNFEALCGLSAIRGYTDTDLSENEPVFHMDAASGSAGAFAVLTALRRREQTGIGELIELSQSENMLNHIGELLIDAERSGTEHGPMGNRHRVHAPQGCYPCEGDDAWAAISVVTNEAWASLCTLMGRDDLAADGRFAGAAGRREHHDEIDRAIAAWTAGQTPYDVFHGCQGVGVAAAPVLHELESLEDPHFAARGLFRENGNESLGTHKYPTHVWRWDGPEMRWNDLPVLGRDNVAVYQGLLGMSDEEYADFSVEGHISNDYLMPDGTPM
jgi:crotonobetainyl-CoA:carnitine CoA-transferase CaiB-like acyl-CoA transferase